MKKLVFILTILQATYCFAQDPSISCQASFTWESSPPYITFSNMSTYGEVGSGDVTFFWYFGDGGNTLVQETGDILYTYISEGDYEVCLTIIIADFLDNQVCTSTYCDVITYSQAPESWSCTFMGCADIGNGAGEYSSQEECESNCLLPSFPESWYCGPSGCFDPGNGAGEYSTLME